MTSHKIFAFAVLAALFALPVRAVPQQQDQQQQDAQKKTQDQKGQQPPPDKPQPSDRPAATAPDDTSESSSRKHVTVDDSEDVAAANAKTEKYDPFPAVHALDIGTYYLHKGDVDAAIDRFQDAVQLNPKLARSRLLLGEAYEKKGDKETALKYYKEYLAILPDAPDAKPVQKKIKKLSQ